MRGRPLAFSRCTDVGRQERTDHSEHIDDEYSDGGYSEEQEVGQQAGVFGQVCKVKGGVNVISPCRIVFYSC